MVPEGVVSTSFSGTAFEVGDIAFDDLAEFVVIGKLGVLVGAEFGALRSTRALIQRFNNVNGTSDRWWRCACGGFASPVRHAMFAEVRCNLLVIARTVQARDVLYLASRQTSSLQIACEPPTLCKLRRFHNAA